MAIKKSELYTSLWASCDELRGGMDASQYKDYVLVLLFIKYVSDKYADVPYAPITVPKGSGFRDMAALKGKPDIGDLINKRIIAPLANANRLSDMPDFNAANKLGTGKEDVIVLLQKVDHPSRVHLDIESDDIEAEVARLEKLGAKRLEKIQTWWVMEAPTGQRFCVIRPQRERFPADVNTWP